MNRKLLSVFLVMLLCLAGAQSPASAEEPTESVSYQYNESGIVEAITTETSYPDGTRKTTITILDTVSQLPVSEDTVIYSVDGSRETVYVTYKRSESGVVLEKSSVSVERDGSELRDLITNNSLGSNTYRKTEAYDRSGNLMMSEEISYFYNEDNVLRSSEQTSFQPNGHDIKTLTTYDETGENPVTTTVDYSYADGSTGTTTMVYQEDSRQSLSDE